MKKYHISPAGEPGVCRAKKNCPFGDMVSDHYSSAEAARAAYEEKQEAEVMGPRMSHTPRNNWKTMTDQERSSVYGNYRLAMKSLRKGGYAADAKQKALAMTADRYHFPVSQVKSIVQMEQDLAQASAHDDPQRRRMKQAAKNREDIVRALWMTVVIDKDGDSLCPSCSGTKDVKIRNDPFKAEIYGISDPMLSCIDCYHRVAEDI